MSLIKTYLYYCQLEKKYIYEDKEISLNIPTVCKNDNSPITNLIINKRPYISNFEKEIKTILTSTIMVNNFGSQYKSITDATTSFTSSTNYITKLRLTTDNIPSGNYRISWKYNWRHTRTTNKFDAIVVITNSNNVNSSYILNTQVEGAIDTSTTNQYNVSGFNTYNIINGIYYIDLQYRTSSSSGSSYIWDTQLEIWRIS